MDARQQLVEEWKAKCEGSLQLPPERGTRFAWVQQIYSRIYRFLISSYGTGNWRGAGDDSVGQHPQVSRNARVVGQLLGQRDDRDAAAALLGAIASCRACMAALDS